MSGSIFPQGLSLPEAGTSLGRSVRVIDDRLFIHATKDGRRALLVSSEDVYAGKIRNALNLRIEHVGHSYDYLVTYGILDQVEYLEQPEGLSQALPFAGLLRDLEGLSRRAIYCSDPLFLIESDIAIPEEKEIALGRFMTGGTPVSASDIVHMKRILPGAPEDELEEIAEVAGIPVKVTGPQQRKGLTGASTAIQGASGPFVLPGREDLARFFNEHVIEIVEDANRYAALGIEFPGGIILEGPTGCGKTFAVERLIEHLGWASYHVEASSVASPYIHETSRKIAEIFNEAIKNAPAVLVVDEMDAFLASRDGSTGQHHLEEVAEFLRRIPEASKSRVLVIGMTNKLELIDAAILRRGRFDHVVHVGNAGTTEIEGLLTSLLGRVPNDISDLDPIAAKLTNRPLSDVSFVVREAGRIAARARKDRIENEDLLAALALVPSRDPDVPRRVGF
ncbi:ATP-binding protein [Qipengyuania sp. MTN3-11]|uniref:ATP-binding protein n=1 Tax=Qipengyuania sp. MTN3-11 TaxID=3056557 RepID=UPI0036F23749